MTLPSPAPRRLRLGTRELVIAFAIIEAVALLWLVTRVHRQRRDTQRRDMRVDSATVHPATHDRP